MEASATPTEALVPVTIVSGFLGSGKTTLLNALLHEPGRKVAVIVNEFGEVGIDGALVAGGEQFVELDNGCLCCALNEDLETTLHTLRDRGGFEHLVIETTGMADPLPVAWTFGRPGLSDFYRVDAIVTVVDSFNLERVLEIPEAQEQIVRADVLVLNKLDLVDDHGRQAELRARTLNTVAPALRPEGGTLPWDVLLASETVQRPTPAETASSHHQHGASFDTWSYECDGVIEEMVLEDFVYDLPEEIYRFKALVRTDTEWEWTLVNAVGGRVDVRPCEPHRPPPRNRLVFIGPGLDREGLQTRCREVFG